MQQQSVAVPHRIPELKDSRLDDLYHDMADLKREQAENGSAKRIKVLEGLWQPSQGIILDVGTGAGSDANQLAKTFKTTTIGIDISPKSTEIARRNYAQTPNLEFRVGDVYDLSKYRDRADLVTAFSCFHHFDNLGDSLHQIYQTLRDGGLLYFQDLNREQLLKLQTWIQVYDKLIQIGRFFYNCRKQVVDGKVRQEDFVNMILNNQIFNSGDPNTNRLKALTYLSYVAAYTPDEVLSAVQNAGFTSQIIAIENGYIGFASKNSNYQILM